MRYILLLCLCILSSLSFAYESGGWEGEGIPVISFKKTSAIFCKTPIIDDTCINKKTIPNIKMAFDNYKHIKNSKVITIKPIKMKALDSFIIQNYNLAISKGTILIKLQYRAEGYHTVEIEGKTYELDLYNYKSKLTNYNKEPITEFWVNVVGKGWLKLPNDSVKFHQREF